MPRRRSINIIKSPPYAFFALLALRLTLLHPPSSIIEINQQNPSTPAFAHRDIVDQRTLSFELCSRPPHQYLYNLSRDLLTQERLIVILCGSSIRCRDPSRADCIALVEETAIILNIHDNWFVCNGFIPSTI
jgi:hypothetical protein